MRLLLPLSMLALTVGQALARPTQYQRPGSLEARTPTVLLEAYKVLLFDALAFADPDDPTKTKAEIHAYVSLPKTGYSIPAFLDEWRASCSIQVAPSQRPTLKQRTELFGTVGVPFTKVRVSVEGCSPGTGALAPTSVMDTGLTSSVLPLGTCDKPKIATVGETLWRDSSAASVFYSPDSGYGIISDIDDTVKITNVLDKAEVFLNTFLRSPKAVLDMPELYAHLSTSLRDALFIYISGSPYQVYPSLRNFIGESYPRARGPIFTQTLTPSNVPAVNHFLFDNSGVTAHHKTTTITHTLGLYPSKKWLLIGDSTQQDPEVYANIFRQNLGKIACIWIRQVDGGANDETRFSRAFAGVPREKWKVFRDEEIGTMRNINVAGGHCS